ncbi:MAG: GNAT family protein [Stappiaceae bacterium]
MIQRQKILFRPMNEADLDALVHWFADFDDVALFERRLPVPLSRESAIANWKSVLQHSDPPTSHWFILEDANAKPVGLCGLQSINYIHGDAIIPLFVAKQHRRKGLAAGMILTLIALAFEQLRLHRVSTIYRSNNMATQKLVASAGFTEEGRIREGWYADGEHHDTIHVGLLKSEWSDRKLVISERLAMSSYELIKTPERPD